MDKNPLGDQLLQFGLTVEESSLYLFLLKVKSATISDISKSPEFRAKHRPNLYKTIANLKQKGFVVEEVKEGRKRIFPEPPREVLDTFLTEQENRIQALRSAAPPLVESLSQIFEQPNVGFLPLPEMLKTFVETLVNPDWIIKEAPESSEIKMLGTIYSVEFNTRRKFGADSAGLVVNKFRYEEHRDEAVNRVKDYQKEQMSQALQVLVSHGPVTVKKFWFEEKSLSIKGLISPIPYSELHVKLNLPGISRGGLATFRLGEFPTLLLSVWGANFNDFKDLVQRTARQFAILPEITSPTS